jgi:hypothetical protein
MKKLSTYLFLILFSFQVSSWADDIRDFQIEGMSIGDSLLDYFSEEEITKKKFYYPKSKKFAAFGKEIPSFKTYESFRVHFKDDDKKYIIKSLEGVISYKNNIEDCYKKMDEIVEELSSVFKDAYKNETKTSIHPWDKSGKSKYTDAQFILQSGDGVRVVCYDWGAKIKMFDTLNVDMSTKEIIYFLDNEAY